MKTLLFLLLAGTALPAPDPATFTPRGIGAGGGMFCPSISPHDPNTLFVAIDMSQVYRTTDGGLHWTLIDFTQLQGKQLTEVQFTSTATKLFAADQRRSNTEATLSQPVTSGDSGLHWSTFAQWKPSSPETHRALSVWADPGRDNTFLCCDIYNDTTTLPSTPRSRIAYYHADDTLGAFTTAWNFADAQGRIAGAFFDAGECWVATNQGFLYSSNGGAAFAAVNAPASGRMLSFAAGKDPATGLRRFYAVTTSASVGPQSWAQNFGSASLTNKVWRMDWTGTGSAWVDATGAIPSSEKPNLVAMARNQADIVFVATSTNQFPYACKVWRASSAGGPWQSIFTIPNNGNLVTGWGGINNRTTNAAQPKVECDITFSVPCGLAVSPTDSNVAVFCDNAVIHRCVNAAGASPVWQQIYTTGDNPGHVPGQYLPAGQEYLGVGLEPTVITHLNWPAPGRIQAAALDLQTLESSTSGKRWGLPYDHATLGGGDCNAVASDSQTGRLFAAVGFINTVYEVNGQDDLNTDNTGPSGTTKLAPGVYHRLPTDTTWTVLKNDFGVLAGQRGANPVWMTADVPRRKLYVCVANSNKVADGIYVFDLDNLGNSPDKKATPTRVVGGVTYDVLHPFNVRILSDGALLASFGPHQEVNASGPYRPTSGVFLLPAGANAWIDRTSDPRLYYHTRDVVVDPANENRWFACVTNTDSPNVKTAVTDPSTNSNVNPQTQGGLWRTEDAGLHWTRIWQGDSTFPGSATSCTIHPETALGEMYLTTRFGGLWRTSDCRAGNPLFSRVTTYGFRAPERVYYDPYDHDKLWIASNGCGIAEAVRPTTFSEWQVRHFGTQTGTAAGTGDPDGDGAVNTLEYALRTDPWVGSPVAAFASATAVSPMGIAFRRNLAATDATWIIESSADLANWSIATQATGLGPWSSPVLGSLTEDEDGIVTYADGILPGAVARRFLRVRVLTP